MDPEAVLDLARRRADEAEVYVSDSEETPVAFEANRLKLLQTRHIRGMGLRVIKDGRLGFAASTRPGERDALVDMALEVAAFGAEARFHLPPPAAYPAVEAFDPATAAVPLAEMVALGQGLIDGVLAAAPELVCDAGVRRTVQRVRILNSAGTDVSYQRTVFRVGVTGERVRDTDMLWVGDEEVSTRPIRDVSRILQHTLTQLERARENVPMRSGELPVIFTPDGVASALLAPLLVAFSGKIVLQGASPLGESLGAQVYDERLTIVDDPLLPWRPSSRPCDDEGVPSRRNLLVERGVVRTFLYDLQTAGMAGRESTASAQRGFASQPSIGATAVVIEPGEHRFEDLVAGIDEGLVVEHVIGAAQGNVLGGEFGGNVVLGYKVERGRIVGRVKNTVIAGNVHQLFKRLGALGNDARWVGAGLYTPSILFERVSVATSGEGAARG